MKFKFQLLEAGWSVFELEHNSIYLYYEPSYITHVYYDLLRALIDINEQIDKDNYRNNIREIKLHLEFALVKIQLAYHGSLVNIKVSEYESMNSSASYHVVMNELVDYKLFATHVVNSGKEILRKYGLVGYRENWCANDFPISSFLQLKNNISGSLSKTIKENEYGQEMRSSNIHDELDEIRNSIIGGKNVIS